MKTRIKNYLSITKKEWNGLVVLVILIMAIMITPYVYQLLRKDSTINFKDFDIAAARLKQAQAADGDGYADDEKIKSPVMVAFNPNNLPVQQWLQLGLSAYQVKVIKNYEAKGGRFYSKADVKKIYSITPEDYTRLAPFISLPESDAEFNEKPFVMVEINGADSAAFTQLKGIGPAFALRIVRYRERLGGFYHKDQLKEVFGIDSVRYHDLEPQLKVNAALVQKLNINTITFNELRLFPYLSYKQANAIVEYRKQHGDYTSVADLKNIVIIDDGILRKIAPYLKF